MQEKYTVLLYSHTTTILTIFLTPNDIKCVNFPHQAILSNFLE